MIFKQYTSNGRRFVIQRKQTRENVCGLCLNANSCKRLKIEREEVRTRENQEHNE